MAILSTSGLAAEDRVVLRTETSAGHIVLRGEVVDWSGEILRIRVGGELRELRTGHVVDLQTPQQPAHTAGIRAFAAGDAEEAARQLTLALSEEPRQWMRREILAMLVRVELARDQRTEAARHFIALFSSDPHTRHLRVIPLDWDTTPPAPDLAAQARIWLRTADTDAVRLLAASTLLFDPTSGEEAAKLLHSLASVIDRRIYPLARAQLWRRTLARGDVPEGEIERWEDRIHEIPEPLRGGAYSLIGRAWARMGNPERAAAALLWLPLVYDANPALAADAALRAADELTKIGRRGEAEVLLDEILKRFSATPAAAELRRRATAG